MTERFFRLFVEDANQRVDVLATVPRPEPRARAHVRGRLAPVQVEPPASQLALGRDAQPRDRVGALRRRPEPIPERVVIRAARRAPPRCRSNRGACSNTDRMTRPGHRVVPGLSPRRTFPLLRRRRPAVSADFFSRSPPPPPRGSHSAIWCLFCFAYALVASGFRSGLDVFDVGRSVARRRSGEDDPRLRPRAPQRGSAPGQVVRPERVRREVRLPPSRVAVRSCTMHPRCSRAVQRAPDRASRRRGGDVALEADVADVQGERGAGVPTPAAVVAVPGGGASSARSFAGAASPGRGRGAPCARRRSATRAASRWRTRCPGSRP